MMGSNNKEERPKYELIEPKCKLNEIELRPELRAQIEEILEDRAHREALLEEGLSPRKLVLLHGPPGCGKTSIAHALAAEAEMSLYLASGAQIISSFVGESNKNIEEVFRFAHEMECVMLVDEFDTFSRDRKRTSNHENDLVNTVLVNMESRPPKGITIACTNLLDLLDPAVLRRFDMIVEVPALTKSALIKVAKGILKGRFEISPEECVSEGKTPSGTVRACKNRLRTAVLAKEKANPREKKKKGIEKGPLDRTGEYSITTIREDAIFGEATMMPAYDSGGLRIPSEALNMAYSFPPTATPRMAELQMLIEKARANTNIKPPNWGTWKEERFKYVYE